jgi:diguanylate cyclase (GGDEF)-like protein
VKILIADDDPISRRLLEATLVRFGHEVVQVSDGLEAVERVLDLDGPRFAILDWVMPGMDGLTACRMIRQKSGGTYVYIILLTTRDRQEDKVAALEAEADDFLTKPCDNLELRARIRSGERVVRLQQELREAQEAYRHEATHDQLTGLFNRAKILDVFSGELKRARREHRPLSVVIADLDHFKHINDTHGHQVGDEALRQAGLRMASVCEEGERAAVGRYGVGRYGGEEFFFVLPGCNAASAAEIGERLRDVIAREPIHVGLVRIPMTVSIGVVSSERSDDASGALIQAADEALYRAKANGRNRVESATVVSR